MKKIREFDHIGRLIKKLRKDENDCWLWTGVTFKEGYGRVVRQGKHRLAHRVMYETFIGKIPEGMELDHLCRVRLCVNPWHLEPVTHAQHMGRFPARMSCPHGHDYSEENTYVNPLGRRICKQCVRDSGKRYRERQKNDLRPERSA